MADQQQKKRGSKLLRRKSKSDQSVDGSLDSKSSKRSIFSRLKRKNKKSKNKTENDASVIHENAEAERQAQVQKAFLSSSNSNHNNNNNNNSSTSKEASKKPYMLKIALLLVDAATRRFELLQLEFDSDKALVSDALSQIPIHVTERVLSGQTYTGVCGASGTEQKRTVPLFEFCKGNDVLVAIPQGTSAEECARLAKPILTDEKVVGMLSTSGINADPWVTVQYSAPRSSSKKNSNTRIVPGEEQTKNGSTILYAILAVVVMAALIYVARVKFSATESEWLPIHMDLNPVWSGCNNVCDASRDFVEKYVVAPPKKESGW